MAARGPLPGPLFPPLLPHPAWCRRAQAGAARGRSGRVSWF